MEAIYRELMLYLLLVIVSTAGLTVSITLAVQDYVATRREKRMKKHTA